MPAILLNSQLNLHSRHAAHILTLNINVKCVGEKRHGGGAREGGGGVQFYFNTVKKDEEVFKTHARRKLIPFKDNGGGGRLETR